MTQFNIEAIQEARRKLLRKAKQFVNEIAPQALQNIDEIYRQFHLRYDDDDLARQLLQKWLIEVDGVFYAKLMLTRVNGNGATLERYSTYIGPSVGIIRKQITKQAQLFAWEIADQVLKDFDEVFHELGLEYHFRIFYPLYTAWLAEVSKRLEWKLNRFRALRLNGKTLPSA